MHKSIFLNIILKNKYILIIFQLILLLIYTFKEYLVIYKDTFLAYLFSIFFIIVLLFSLYKNYSEKTNIISEEYTLLSIILIEVGLLFKVIVT
jgi:hypothetical protein